MKLTTTEKRALAYCEALKLNGGGSIVVEWKRSATWGSNPVIESNDGKCTNVSGCGYCKLSTALADVLQFLFEGGERQTIARQGGCGERAVIHALKELGWTLEPQVNTQKLNVYQLTKD